MKRTVKAILRPLWRLAGPIRRPIAGRVESWFFGRIEPRVRRLSGEIVPGLDGLLRELERLQAQIDALHEALAAAHAEKAADRAKAG